MLDLARRVCSCFNAARAAASMPLSTAACARAMHDAIFRDCDGDHPRVVEFNADQQFRYRPQSLLSWSFRPASGAAAESSSSLWNNCWSMRSSSERQLVLVRRVDHNHAAAFGGRKPSIVQVVAVHGHQRTAKLLRELIVPEVRRASQVVFLQHEQDVPLQAAPHVSDQACRHVRVGVDPRPRRQPFGVRRELGREGSHEFKLQFKLLSSDF